MPPVLPIKRRARNVRLPARQRSRRRWLRNASIIALVAVLAPVAFCVWSGVVRKVPSASSVMAEIEGLEEAAGLGLLQVEVTGHRFTLDGDIFDALDLENARTLLSFETRAAQIRIESLPWVARASIERIFPDRVAVHIVERTPFAVWQRGESSYLIDKVGRVLAPVPRDNSPSLPRVAGEGAATTAAALYTHLADFPVIARQVRLAERIGERRWTLRLANGGTIELPANGEQSALSTAQTLLGAVAEPSQIDLRASARPRVRELHALQRAADAAASRGGL